MILNSSASSKSAKQRTLEAATARYGSELLCFLLRKTFSSRLVRYNVKLNEEDASRIVEMAWEDRTPFEAIEAQFGVNEAEVIRLMRSMLKRRSFKVWRERVSGRATKHVELRSPEVSRGYCPTQYKHKK